MQDFGPLAGLVGTVGSIVAAVGAIALTWRGRTRWEPSEADVASGPQRVGGLVNVVLIAVLWAATRPAGTPAVLPVLAIGLAAVTVAALLGYGFVTSTQTYADQKRRRKVIGGFELTAEARREIRKQKLTVQQYFDGVAYDPDEVWPRSSRALAKLVFVLLYLLLVVSGTVAVAAAAIMVEKQATGQPTPTPTPTPVPTATPTASPFVTQRTLRWVDGPVSAVVLDGGVLEAGKSVWLQELFPGTPPSAFAVSEVVDDRLPQEVRDALAALQPPRFAPAITGFRAVSDSPWRLPSPLPGVGYRTFTFSDENPEGGTFVSGTIASGPAQVAIDTQAPGCLAADPNGVYGGTLDTSSCLELTVGAAVDPTFEVRLLVPWGEDESDLIAAVRGYLEGLEAALARESRATRFSADAALRSFLREQAAFLPVGIPPRWEFLIEPDVFEAGPGASVRVRLGITPRSGGSALIAVAVVDVRDGSMVMSPLVPLRIEGNATPEVSIVEPPVNLVGPGDRQPYGGFDQARGMWFTDLNVAASALDPEDGILSGGSVAWTTDRTDLQEAELGYGDSLAVRLFSRDCEGGAVHTLTVTVRDSQGVVATASRAVEIGQLC